jgi:hypothetical protein
MIHRSIAKTRRKNVFAFLFALTCTALLAPPAFAQNFCDLVPASAVKSTLGIAEKLVAKPITEASNGCHYMENGHGPIILIANTSDASGMRGTMFEQRLTSLGPNAQLIQGLGEAAYYSETDNEQIPKFPGVTYTQQSVVFRAKGKIVSLTVTTAGSGIPKEALQALANLVVSKPLDSLVDPSN